VTRSNFAARQGRGGGADVNYEDRLAEALLELCFERGYRNTDLPMLLERAGVDQVTFHRHFEDLEDCFCAVYLGIREDFLARLEGAVAGEAAWRDRLRAAAYFLLDYFREDERVTQFGIVEIRYAGERAQRLLAEVIEALFDLLDEGRGENDDASRTRATAEAIGGGIFRQISLAVERGTLDEQGVPQMMYAAVLPYLGMHAAREELGIPPPAGASLTDGR
jgi:AcrR family transcriptional regulator